MTNIDAGRVDSTVLSHLKKQWPTRKVLEFEWAVGPISSSISGFRVAVLPPEDGNEPWIYSSCGAWKVPTSEDARYEFFLMAPSENAAHIETLTMLAHFHADENYSVGPGSIIDLGRPWVDGVSCDHALISLPYMQGCDFEWVASSGGAPTLRFLWVVPITAQEARFARSNGIEALEELLDESGVDVLDFGRKSLK